MSKTLTAFIWRESIYKNDFRCKCGSELADANGNPKGGTMYNPAEDTLICPECDMVVAKLKEVTVPDDTPEGLSGRWSDFSSEPVFDNNKVLN